MLLGVLLVKLVGDEAESPDSRDDAHNHGPHDRAGGGGVRENVLSCVLHCRGQKGSEVDGHGLVRSSLVAALQPSPIVGEVALANNAVRARLLGDQRAVALREGHEAVGGRVEEGALHLRRARAVDHSGDQGALLIEDLGCRPEQVLRDSEDAPDQRQGRRRAAAAGGNAMNSRDHLPTGQVRLRIDVGGAPEANDPNSKRILVFAGLALQGPEKIVAHGQRRNQIRIRRRLRGVSALRQLHDNGLLIVRHQLPSDA
mmetsp:Transcript_15108/g.57387  ORF Transcript_15108/g.57387 Transcript_15108/m.57387 type:complete len:257 (-) Transcript_15108:1365-2135(-)|eukprot:scaffold2979_cov243-Pinguiococcus_pyrenoidosus.AAC.21